MEKYKGSKKKCFVRNNERLREVWRKQQAKKKCT